MIALSKTGGVLRSAPARLFTLHSGDARNLDSLLSPYSSERSPLLNCTVTSPPYGALKDYGHPDQIGWGQPHDEYLTEIKRVFRTIARHTRDDGTMWVVADTLRSGDDPLSRLEPLPFQLAEQATEAGWILRDVIIWKKDKTLPWSGRGRLRNTFEYVMLFVKTATFKYYLDRIREPTELKEWWVRYPERYNPIGKAPGNVWEIPIPVQGSWRNTSIDHMCPLPADLVERLLLLTTDPSDVVLDPFAGSGVVLAEAERLRRRPIGIELIKRNVTDFQRKVRPEMLSRDGDGVEKRAKESAWLEDVILKLRALKYPRVLLQQLAKQRPAQPLPQLAAVLVSSGAKPQINGKLVSAKVVFLLEDREEKGQLLRQALMELASRPPASKFGVDAQILVVGKKECRRLLGRRSLYLYLNGKTYSADRKIGPQKLIEFATSSPARGVFPPIASNVEVHEHPRPLTKNEALEEGVTTAQGL